MGQRLNIQIEHDGIIYANCYMHWDAYTRIALENTEDILKFIGNRKYSVNSFDKKEAGEILRNSLPGSGYKDDSIKFYDLPIKYAARSRNDGLIGLTDADIQNTISWEDNRVTIDPIDRFISFNVVCFYSKEEFKDAFEEEFTDEEINDFKEIDSDFNFEHIDFKKFDAFCRFLFSEIIDEPPVKYKNKILWEV